MIIIRLARGRIIIIIARLKRRTHARAHEQKKKEIVCEHEHPEYAVQTRVTVCERTCPKKNNYTSVISYYYTYCRLRTPLSIIFYIVTIIIGILCIITLQCRAVVLAGFCLLFSLREVTDLIVAVHTHTILLGTAHTHAHSIPV